MPFHFSYKDLSLTESCSLQMVCLNSFSCPLRFLKYLYLKLIQRYMIFKDVRFFLLGYASVTQQRSALLCFAYGMFIYLTTSFWLTSLMAFFQISVCLSFSKHLLLDPWLFELLTPGTMPPRSERIKVLNYPVRLEVSLHTTLASGKWGREGDENWT